MIDWLKANPNGSNIINVASFAAIAPSPSMAPYNVTKAGIMALSETLYGELKPHGVGVTVVCPMHFQTNINSSARSYNKVKSEIVAKLTEKSTQTAAEVADASIRAMYRRQLYVVPGWRARCYWWMRRITPTAFLNGMARDAQRQAAEMEASRDRSQGTA
jgi:short-subunit dehydrogenase